MKTRVSLTSERNPFSMLRLVKSTIDAEMRKLELAVELAERRLRPFEEKYRTTSEEFLAHYAAEDLDGGDDEYICWAGEYRLKQRLLEKLATLREIENDDPGVFYAHQHAA